MFCFPLKCFCIPECRQGADWLLPGAGSIGGDGVGDAGRWWEALRLICKGGNGFCLWTRDQEGCRGGQMPPGCDCMWFSVIFLVSSFLHTRQTIVMYKWCKNSHLFFFIKYNKPTCYLNTTLLTIYLFVNIEFILVLKFTPHRQDRGLCHPVPFLLADDLERVKVLQNAHWWKAYISSKSMVRFLSLSSVCCKFVQVLSLKCLWVWRCLQDFRQIFFSLLWLIWGKENSLFLQEVSTRIIVSENCVLQKRN